MEFQIGLNYGGGNSRRQQLIFDNRTIDSVKAFAEVNGSTSDLETKHRGMLNVEASSPPGIFGPTTWNASKQFITSPFINPGRQRRQPGLGPFSVKNWQEKEAPVVSQLMRWFSRFA